MRRAMSVWSPNWPITRLKRAQKSVMGARLPEHPGGLATMAMEDSARRLATVDDVAASLGAKPGQTVPDAIALNPHLTIVEADPDADLTALEALAEWCLRFSPLVAADGPDGLFLDIAGCAHLWGGEEGLARMLIARLSAQDIPARIGIADTFGAAWALARFGRRAIAIAPHESGDEAAKESAPLPLWERGRGEGDDGAALILEQNTLRLGSPSPPAPLPRGERGDSIRRRWQSAKGEGRGPSSLATLLAPLPVAALRIDPDTQHKLRHLGLKTVGQVAALPRSPLRKRFGVELPLRLAQAFGEADETLVFRHPHDAWIERRVFAEAISTPEDLGRSVADLAEQLCARLDAHGLGARRFEATFHRVDGAAAHREVTAALPVREPKSLAKLFAAKLETLDPGFGVEVVTLLADVVEPLRIAQVDLVDAASDARDADLAPLIDRLRNTLGEDRVWRAVPVESHVPERAVGRTEPLASPSGQGWDPDKPRPIRLFDRPEPIEAIAPVPDDPPLLFRWRGRLHRIARAEGPERVGAEWWRKPWEDMQGEASVERVRDYYRVEDEDGARFWVFRSGLYGGERPTRWWLHGLFA